MVCLAYLVRHAVNHLNYLKHQPLPAAPPRLLQFAGLRPAVEASCLVWAAAQVAAVGLEALHAYEGAASLHFLPAKA